MKSTKLMGIVLTVALTGLISPDLISKEPPGAKRPKNQASLLKVTGTPEYAILAINNITTWVRYDGHSNHSPMGDDGAYYPRGTGSFIYQDGIVWGGSMYLDAARTVPYSSVSINQNVRVGGGTYGVGTRAGRVVDPSIGPSGVEYPGAPDVHIYRIRRDYAFMSRVEREASAAAVNEIGPENVTQAMIDADSARFAVDWTNWPVAKGAPYIERNGVPGYQPPPAFSEAFGVDDLITGHYDEPGLAGADLSAPADEVLWTVYNDLNVAETQSFEGSDPIGLEIQKTVWGYKRTDAIGNVWFNRYRLMNKGGVDRDASDAVSYGAFHVDSMYVCQWSDVDLGNAGDDLLGCDTLLNIGFAYNGNVRDDEYDLFSMPPPSAGYDLLSGPLVTAPGDSGIFDLKWIHGKKNLGMTSFAYFSSSSPYQDPPWVDYLNGTGRWWKLLRGFAPLGSLVTADQPYNYPAGIEPSVFTLSGDPVAGTGWLDGKGEPSSIVPGDRRLLVTTGPFTMVPGDTQEVYIAGVAGMGADRLSSVAVMKANARAAQNLFDHLFGGTPVVNRLVEIRHPGAAVTELAIRATPPPGMVVQFGEILFQPEAGSEPTFSTPLFDDGAHFDSLAGDGIWGAVQATSNRQYPYRAKLTLQTSAGPIVLEDFLTGLTLRPRPVLSDWSIVWEDGKQDGKLNPNENVIVSFSVHNVDPVNAINQLTVLNEGVSPFESNRSATALAPISPGATASGEVFTLSFHTALSESSASLLYTVAYDGVAYSSNARFPVEPWTPDASWRDTLEVLKSVGVTMNVIPVIADPAAITGHDYLVSFVTLNDTTGEVGWSLQDMNTSAWLLTAQRLSTNIDGWPHPVVDGVQYIVRNVPTDFVDFQQLSDGAGPLNPPHFASFGFIGVPTTLAPQDRPTPDAGGGQWGIITGNTGSTMSYDYFVLRVTNGGARWPILLRNDWEIRFTAGPNYGLEPDAFTGMGNNFMRVPFELWYVGPDPNDASDDYRLFPYMIGDGDSTFDITRFDNNVSGGDNDPETDWFYWVIPTDKTPGQAGYNAIVSSIQANIPGHAYMDPAIMNGDAMRRMVLVNYNGGSVASPTFPENLTSKMPATGSVFRIVTGKPNVAGDRVVVRAIATTGVGGNGIVPDRIDLAQNYPNPFNPVTSIRYQIPQKATVKLEVFDVLGRKVQTLVNKEHVPGSYVVEWDGKTSHGISVSTGVYFYSLTVGDRLMTKKMVLLK